MDWFTKFLIFLRLKKEPKYERLPEFQRFEDTLLKTFNEAYEFFVKELDLEQYRSQIDEVTHVGTTESWVKKYGMDKDSDGYCQYISTPKGRGVRILVRTTGTVFGAVEILAHEMVHAQQFFHNKTQFVQGELYHLGEPYKHLPWNARTCEAEARSLQHQLTLKFIQQMERDYKSWL